MIAARAYERVAAAVIAEELGVPPRFARASVRDERGGIAADLTCSVGMSDIPIAQQAKDARTRAAGRLADLTGAQVAGVRLRITDIIDEKRRTA